MISCCELTLTHDVTLNCEPIFGGQVSLSEKMCKVTSTQIIAFTEFKNKQEFRPKKVLTRVSICKNLTDSSRAENRDLSEHN